MKLHRDLGIAQKSAYFMAQRLLEAWPDLVVDKEGPVEANKSYFGLKRKIFLRSKRRKTAGQGMVGKTAVAGVKDRNAKSVTVRVLQATAPQRCRISFVPMLCLAQQSKR